MSKVALFATFSAAPADGVTAPELDAVRIALGQADADAAAARQALADAFAAHEAGDATDAELAAAQQADADARAALQAAVVTAQAAVDAAQNQSADAAFDAEAITRAAADTALDQRLVRVETAAHDGTAQDAALAAHVAERLTAHPPSPAGVADGHVLGVAGGQMAWGAPVAVTPGEVAVRSGAPDAADNVHLVWIDAATADWPTYYRAAATDAWPSAPTGRVFDGDQTGPWDAAKTYATGSVVTYGPLLFVAQRQSTGVTPSMSLEDWRPAMPWFGDSWSHAAEQFVDTDDDLADIDSRWSIAEGALITAFDAGSRDWNGDGSPIALDAGDVLEYRAGVWAKRTVAALPGPLIVVPGTAVDLAAVLPETGFRFARSFDASAITATWKTGTPAVTWREDGLAMGPNAEHDTTGSMWMLVRNDDLVEIRRLGKHYEPSQWGAEHRDIPIAANASGATGQPWTATCATFNVGTRRYVDIDVIMRQRLMIGGESSAGSPTGGTVRLKDGAGAVLLTHDFRYRLYQRGQGFTSDHWIGYVGSLGAAVLEPGTYTLEFTSASPQGVGGRRHTWAISGEAELTEYTGEVVASEPTLRVQSGYRQLAGAGSAQTPVTFPDPFPAGGSVSVTADLVWNYDAGSNGTLTERGLVFDGRPSHTGFAVRGVGAVNALDGVQWTATWQP